MSAIQLNLKKVKGETDIATCLQSHYSKGITGFEKQFDTGVIEWKK